jgi:hypothetical protein
MAVLERLLARWGTVWWRRIASRSAAAFAGKRRWCRRRQAARGHGTVSGGFWLRRRCSGCREGVQGWRRTSGRRVAVARAGRHASARPCRSCRAMTSRACAGLGVVVHLSTNGGQRRVQGIKEGQRDTMARARGERRGGVVSMVTMAGMAMACMLG